MKHKGYNGDPLLNANEAVLTVIDYQPTQINSIASMPKSVLLRNAELVIKFAKLFDIPIVLSTVNVENGRNEDTIPRLKNLIGQDVPSYDRTTINAWEDEAFKKAVEDTGRKQIIILGLWTEACMTFPTIYALNEGYEVYPVVDAIAGTSKLAHRTALKRVEQAGAFLTTLPQLGCSLQRDWAREATVPGFVELMTEVGAFTSFE